MGIDSSIAMGVRTPQLESPVNALAQMMQIQGVQRQNQLGQMQMDKHQQDVGENNRLNTLYAGALRPDGTIDQNKVIQGAAANRLGSKIPGLRKGFLDEDEQRGKVAKQKFEILEAATKQSRSYLDGVTTPEQYLAWHEANHADPILGPALAARGITTEQSRASIMQKLQSPGGLQKLINESAVGIERFTELNKPTIQKEDLGGMSRVSAIPGLGGAPTVLSNTPITQDANSIASAAQSNTNSLRTDERARDLNVIKTEENNIKRSQKNDDLNLMKGSQIASFDTMLGTLERLSKHPGLSRSVGITGALPTIPGSNSANFQAELNTFQSQAFLPMVAQLKGMGALSDAEGKKLTAAVGALDPKMGEEAFRDSVARITADMQAARDRMVGGTAQPTPKPAGKTASMADIQATAKASGKTVEEVKAAMKAKGYVVN